MTFVLVHGPSNPGYAYLVIFELLVADNIKTQLDAVQSIVADPHVLIQVVEIGVREVAGIP